MRKLFIFSLIVFPVLALAQAADDTAFIGQLLSAIQGRNWILVVSAVLSGLIYVLRRWGLSWVPWFNTDRGGAILTLVVGVLGALVSALVGGKFSLQSFIDGLILAMNTAGGFVLVKRILAPADKPTPVAPA